MNRAVSTKICRDCKFFTGLTCKKYFITDIVTGEKSYYYARSVRENEKKCGENAVDFEKNHYKIATVPYYFVKNNFIICLTPVIAGSYVSMLCWLISRN